MAGEFAIAGDDIATGLCGVGRLDDEGIVAADDVAIVDADVFTGVDVDAVVVRHAEAAAANGDAIDDGAAGLEEIEGPCAGVCEMDVLYGDIGAADPSQEEGPHGVGMLSGFELGALAIDGALALDADVCRIECDDEGMAHGVAAAVGEGIDVAIVGGVGAAQQCGLVFESQRDVAFDLDGAGEVAVWRGRRGCLRLRRRSRRWLSGWRRCRAWRRRR